MCVAPVNSDTNDILFIYNSISIGISISRRNVFKRKHCPWLPNICYRIISNTNIMEINTKRKDVIFINHAIIICITRVNGKFLNCFKCCAVSFPLICIATPYTALIQNSALQQATMFGIMIVKSFAVIFAFPCSIILLTNSAVSLRILGTLNGFAVSISAVGRAIGPALGGAAFTWGIERGYVVTPYFMLAIISSIGAIPIWYLVEMPGFSKTDDSSETEDDDDDEEEED